MPRLNGNSSHGSKPITSLSRTFNCTPHCCPQKQQWVLTRRSGSVLVESRRPSIAERCGPNRSMMCSGSTGRVAMVLAVRRRHSVRQMFAPRPALSETDQRPPAARAYLLIVFGALLHLVGESELLLHQGQVSDHHQ